MTDPPARSPEGSSRQGQARPRQLAKESLTPALLNRRGAIARVTQVGAVATLLIALWGAYTGTTSWLADRRIDVELSGDRAGYAAPNSALGRGSRPDAEVAIVNASRRGVNLTRGDIWLGGKRVGRVDGVIPENQPLDEQAVWLNPDKFTMRLPMALAPESSLPARLLWQPERAAVERLDAMSMRTDKEFERTNGRRSSIATVSVRLRFEPGGWRQVRLPMDTLALPDISNNEASVWYDKLRAVAVTLYWPSRRPNIATVRLWRNDAPRPTRTEQQPIAGTGMISIPLHALPDGNYKWTLSAGEQQLTGGYFRTPCRSRKAVSKDGGPVELRESALPDSCRGLTFP
jgi:hypothetical protein